MKKNEQQVVVRFAPSPTGYLHIGGARTAIFNWLFARKHHGKFILRIEDTDAERSTEDSIQGIVDGLRWLGLEWDEGPNFQSRRITAHQDAAGQLIDTGHAYKCFCTQEAIEEKRQAAAETKETYRYDGTCRNLSDDAVMKKEAKGLPYVVRMKVPDTGGGIVFEDAVYRTVEKKYQDMEDFIIVRSNGMPLYVLSNAVDDIEDGVTHIIRGQDGLANTPKQILIYQALGKPLPVFAHMSLTLDPQKAKISKRRHGEMVAVHYYREKGFLPWAFVNFLVLLGWATPDSQEIFSKEELVEAFRLEGISRTNSVFNINQADPRFFTDPKALNINAHYIKTMPLYDLVPEIKRVLKDYHLWDPAYEADKKVWFENTVDLIRERYHLLTDFAQKGGAYFSDDVEKDPAAVKKHLIGQPEMKNWLPQIGAAFEQMDDFSDAAVETLFRHYLAEFKVKPAVLINAVRVALTGHASGPDFIKSVVAIGKDRTAVRLKAVSGLY